MDSFVQKDLSAVFPPASPMMIERGIQWKTSLEENEELKAHLLSTLSHIGNINGLIN